MIVGGSVHNQRIERLWRDVFTGVVKFYKELFLHLEETSLLDPDDELCVFALHYIYIPRINRQPVWCRWRLVIHGGIDGYSRIPVYLLLNTMVCLLELGVTKVEKMLMLQCLCWSIHYVVMITRSWERFHDCWR